MLWFKLVLKPHKNLVKYLSLTFHWLKCSEIVPESVCGINLEVKEDDSKQDKR
jgi:hypothetical protein